MCSSDLLRDLGAGRDADGAAAGRLPGSRSAMRPEPQMSLFSDPADQLRLEIRAIDVERLTPLDALHKLHELAEKARREAVEYHLETGLLPPEARKAVATPLIRHGIAANRKVLETAAQYSFEQGLTPRLMKLEELFAPSVMEQ